MKNSLCPDCVVTVLREIQCHFDDALFDLDDGHDLEEVVKDFERANRELRSLAETIEQGGLCGVSPTRKS